MMNVEWIPTPIKQTSISITKRVRWSIKMCDFLNIPIETKVSRAEVIAAITTYIKYNNLLVPNTKAQYIPDAKLSAILGPLTDSDSPSGFTFFNHLPYIYKHAKKR